MQKETHIQELGASNGHERTAIRPWMVATAAVLVTLIFTHVTFIRPARHQLTQLQQQVTYLRQNIDELAGKGGAAYRTNSLLQQLTDQADQAAPAAESLAQIASLHERLKDEASQLAESKRAIDNLCALRNDVQKNTALIQQTDEALTSMFELQARILDSTELTSEAQTISEELLGLNRRILSEGQQVTSAQSTLDELIDLRAKLDEQSSDLQLADDRVTSLIQLKDNVIARTENLTEAIETFERTADMQQQFHEASKAFEEVRHVLAEVVMLRPGIAQVAKHLEPLTDLVNLRRLSTANIHQMAQTIVADRREQFAAEPDATSNVAPVVANKDNLTSTFTD